LALAGLAGRLDIIAETGSTNADLLARIAAGNTPDEGYWLIADRQTQGRGRQGRSWLDGAGNFMGSTLVELRDGDPQPSSLSFAAALAVYAATSGNIARPSALQLKWPNDVLLGGVKFCGILLERGSTHAVVGIGVNLAGSPKLADRETLALSQLGQTPDRDLFAADLANAFERELELWRRQGLGALLARWQAAAHRPGTRLSVHTGSDKRVTGTYDGLEPDGALRLSLDGGSRTVIYAGDVMLEGE